MFTVWTDIFDYKNPQKPLTLMYTSALWEMSLLL